MGSFVFYPEFPVIFIRTGWVPLGNGIRIRFDPEWGHLFFIRNSESFSSGTDRCPWETESGSNLIRIGSNFIRLF
ncbi:hypothetical protein HOLleu_45078 [Holothuria leucospilota]|uniref:Uncharacterized protein n=1 Tax=Holothuria leucospilota TaxID=206669 RepID=A0A9Q0YA77_HOLLE|nr:hypothetical protein HOLleu_45078 [Holothuria leucospilota]